MPSPTSISIPRHRLDYLKRQILDTPEPAKLRHPSQVDQPYWSGLDIFIVPEVGRAPGQHDAGVGITFDTPHAEAVSWFMATLAEEFAPQRQRYECVYALSAALIALLEALEAYDERHVRKLLASMLYATYHLSGYIDVELVEFLGRYDDVDFRGSIEDELRSFDPEAP